MKGEKCHQAAFASTLLPPVLLQCYYRRARLPRQAVEGAGPYCFANSVRAGPATEPGPMPRSPNKVPENIEFAVQELLEAPADQRAGTGAVEVAVLPTINAGGGARWDPISTLFFVSVSFC